MAYKGLVTYTPSGLYCEAGNFYIDPVKPVARAVISHAHADHANPYSGEMYCTPSTMALVKHRYRNRETGLFIAKNFHETFVFGKTEVTLIPAGHMLGSAQVLIADGNERWLYTGDFKLQPDPTCEPFEYVAADVLVTETTFADPGVQHPDPIMEICKLNEFENRNVILAAYSMGKAQRLARMLAEHCPQRLVMVHPDIHGFNRVYESFGITLGAWVPYQAAEFKSIRHGIYLAPPFHFRNFRKSQKHWLAFASGWEMLQKRCDLRLMISDHGDWRDILKVVDFINPKKIYTLHGDGKLLRNLMAERGLEAAKFN
jgi:putative mRNA 3-end processing factor